MSILVSVGAKSNLTGLLSVLLSFAHIFHFWYFAIRTDLGSPSQFNTRSSPGLGVQCCFGLRLSSSHMLQAPWHIPPYSISHTSHSWWVLKGLESLKKARWYYFGASSFTFTRIAWSAMCLSSSSNSTEFSSIQLCSLSPWVETCSIRASSRV